MATSFDSLLNGTTVTIGGEAITLSSLTDNERGILAIALAALQATKTTRLVQEDYCTGGVALVPRKIVRSTGASGSLVVTPGSG